MVYLALRMWRNRNRYGELAPVSKVEKFTEPQSFPELTRTERGCLMQVWLKRAYEQPGDNDGYRILVDRIWPRGVSKEKLKLDAWLKELAPSAELRRWFGHDPEKWNEFKHRFFVELDGCKTAMEELLFFTKKGQVTLIFAAHDEKHNNAVALKEYLETKFNC